MTASIGIIGTGSIAAATHIPVLRAMPSVSIAWITDANEERGRHTARAHRLPFVGLESDPRRLPSCDVVLLAIPLLGRELYFDAYANTHTCVFSEKPLAVSSAEHLRLISIFDVWRLSVGYQRRFYATSRLLRRFIKSGVLGALHEIVVSEGGRTTRTGGGGAYMDESVVRGGGITKNLGCHSLDLAFWLTGATRFTVVDRSVEWDLETDRKSAATVQLFSDVSSMAQECTMRWTMSWLDDQQNILELHFERASLRVPTFPTSTIELCGSAGDVLAKLNVDAQEGALTSAQAFYLEWKDVVDGVALQREGELSASSCYIAAQLMDEILAR